MGGGPRCPSSVHPEPPRRKRIPARLFSGRGGDLSERRRILVALPVLLVLLGASASRLTRENPFFSRGISPVTTGPAPKGAIGLDAESCGTCHPREYAAWSASLHAK